MSEFEGTWEGMEDTWREYRATKTPDVPAQGFMEFGDDGHPLTDYSDPNRLSPNTSASTSRKLAVYNLQPDMVTSPTEGGCLITPRFTLSEFVPYDVRAKKT